MAANARHTHPGPIEDHGLISRVHVPCNDGHLFKLPPPPPCRLCRLTLRRDFVIPGAQRRVIVRRKIPFHVYRLLLCVPLLPARILEAGLTADSGRGLFFVNAHRPRLDHGNAPPALFLHLFLHLFLQLLLFAPRLYVRVPRSLVRLYNPYGPRKNYCYSGISPLFPSLNKCLPVFAHIRPRAPPR
jgi:hypothetical protein